MLHVTVKVVLIFVTFSLAVSSPVNQKKCKAIVAEASGYEPKDGSKENNSLDDCSSDQLKEDFSASSSETKEFNSKSNPKEDSSLRYIQAGTDSAQPTYQSDSVGRLSEMGVGIGNLGGVLYPHVHPKLLAAYNSGITINSLPPVQSTYIHGLIPMEDLQRTNYELDDFSQSYMISPSLMRAGRMVRSQDEEILAELQHDAIMNNILPTMPVPFARYAAPAPVYQYSSPNVSPAIAVFPSGAGGGCAQPILLSCSPKITRGTLQPIAPIESAHSLHASSGATSFAYRQPSEQSTKSVSDEKQSSPVKVNLPSSEKPLSNVK